MNTKKKRKLLNSKLANLVFDACSKLKDIENAQTIWNYIINASNCVHPPAQLTYSRLLMVYSSTFADYSMPDNMISAALKIVNEYIMRYKSEPLSLFIGFQERTQTGNHAIIFNQIMKLILFKSTLEIKQQKQWINYYYDQMQQLKIPPDPETMRLINFTLHAQRMKPKPGKSSKASYHPEAKYYDTMSRNTSHALYTYYSSLLANGGISNYQHIIVSFKSLIMNRQGIKGKIKLYHSQLAYPVLIACYRLNDVENAQMIIDYIINPENSKFPPKQVMFSQMLNFYSSITYSADNVISNEMAKKAMKVVDEYIKSYKTNKDAILHGIDKLDLKRKNYPIIFNQIMKIILLKQIGITLKRDDVLIIIPFK